MVGQNKSATFTSPKLDKVSSQSMKTSRPSDIAGGHLKQVTSCGQLFGKVAKLVNWRFLTSYKYHPSTSSVTYDCFHLHLKDSTSVKSFFRKKPNHPKFPKGVSQSHFATGARGGSKIPGRCRHPPRAHPFVTVKKFLTNPTASAVLFFWFVFAWKKNPMKKR